MRKYLQYDPETRELRLVYTDLWDGQHEQTEYRVTGSRGGDVVRSRPDLDGEPVLGTVPGLYIEGPQGAAIPVWTQDAAVGPTVKTPCPKASNARRKCGLCATGKREETR
jgi:hypothetical protein